MKQEAFELAGLVEMSVVDLVAAAERAKAEGGLAAAIAVYESWLALNGDDGLAHVAYFNLGVAYNEAGEAAKAARAFRDGARVQPEFAPLRLNLGRALETLGQPKAALDQWRQALEKLAGVTGEAVEQRGLLLTQSARLLQHHVLDGLAETLLTEAIDLDPNHEAAVREWLGLRTRQCRWPAISASSRVSAERQRSYVWPLTLAALADDPLFQLAKACRHARNEFPRPSRAQLEQVSRARKPKSAANRARLKIGYVSSDLRDHAVGHGMTEVFEKHDRARFEIHAYYCGIEREDSTRARIRSSVEHWRDISAMSDEQAALAIARDGIDVLVDLNGYTKFARTPIFALRPAPAQVNWFGYPSTMGTPYHHYLIADEAIVPRGDEIFYSEEVLRLPCYQPNDRLREIAAQPKRTDFGLPDDAFVFCSFNATQKLTQRAFDLWLAILKASPGAVLWMLEGTKETNDRLAEYARNAGLDPARLIWAPKLSNPEHLARYPLADLFLDSFPWGAHTTASDALWQGVPILTQTGRTFAARVCTSLVRAAGVPELACETEGEYVGKALALAANPHVLQSIKGRLRAARDSCALFDVDRLTRALEGLYVEIARREAQGRTPRPDLANLDIYHQIGVKLDIEATNRLSRDAYLQTYRDALAEIDMHDPLGADSRLWRAEGAEKRLALGA